MAHPGECEAPPIGWETLCDDLKLLILKNLSMRDLFRAATVSRIFRDPCLRDLCAAQERANLVEAAEEAYGKGFVSRFLTAIRRTLCGLIPFPGVRGKEVVITNAGVSLSHVLTEPRVGIIRKPSERTCIEVFQAEIYNHFTGGRIAMSSKTSWRLFRFGEIMRLEVDGPLGELQVSLGLLLAVCLEIPKALPTSSHLPLMIRLAVQVDEAGVREAQDLMAPLRFLDKTAVFKSRFMMGHMFNDYSYGQLRVVPLVVFNWTWKV